MGNCLFSQGADDVSLLNESEGGSLPGEPPPPDQERPQPVYHPRPGERRLASQLTEEEQIRIAQRIGLIQHLPKGLFDPGSDPSDKKVKEYGPSLRISSLSVSIKVNVCLFFSRCVICMMDFEYGDPVRFLPCLHIYHVDCIDPWLMRSFTCPSCMEPVDAALLSSYEAN
ncbi:hypothetical protein NQD34_000103 [Periophthalmus magnuspinnatus]|nr:hypothetical protein NQD34_000103 [Periophthalmus magnuspinnatus]